MALVIFAADWYFVNRRKNLDKAKPITADEIVGSIISLDKRKSPKIKKVSKSDLYRLFLVFSSLSTYSVFEEKNLDSDGHDSILKGVHSDGQKRILVATRHTRNDSRGIQLEMKYGSDGETPAPVLAAGKLPFKKSHIRSSSCDVKFMRDFDSNESKFLKIPKKCHSRTSSRDMEQEFRKRFSNSQHSRNNSDHLNIKCIINYLKSGPKNGMLNEEASMGGSSGGGSATGSRRGHSRNHSYDRIYTASNNEAFMPDYLDQQQQPPQQLGHEEGHHLHHDVKDVNVRRGEELENKNKFLEIVAPAAVAAIELLVPTSFESKYTHSRNNSKDFNVKLQDEFAGTAANLRHRRTSSRDLNVINRRNSLSQPQRERVGGEDEEVVGGSSSTGLMMPGQSLLHFNNNNHNNNTTDNGRRE